MTKEEHIKKHKKLHKSLDELLANFIYHTGKLPSNTNLMVFLKWSYKQTIDPTFK